MQLKEFVTSFNNREISVLIWLIVFLAWIIPKSKSGKSALSLIKQLLHYKIFVPYLLAVVYCLAGVYILSKLNLWADAQLKDTILWCLLVILPSIISVTNAKENKNYFKDAIKENLKFSIVIEFVTGVYTFSLPIELVLVPTVIFIGLMQAVAGTDNKYALVQKYLNGIFYIICIVIIGHTINQIRLHITQFASIDTLKDFILSPFLALWFIPFLYLLSLYMTYEVYYISMGFVIKDKKLLNYARWRALLYFRTDVAGFERWKDRLFIGSPSTKTKQDIDNSIKNIKRLQKVEENPPEVNNHLGWSPYAAKDFLLSKGISTKYYINTYEDEWSASSDYIRLDNNNIMANMVTYYIEGNETIAKCLRLSLNVNNPKDETAAIIKLLEYAKSLYAAATKKVLPDTIANAILKKKNYQLIEGSNLLKVRKEDWFNQNKYSLMFYIEHQ